MGILNAQQLNIEVKNKGNRVPYFKKVFRDALLTSFIMTIIYGIYTFFFFQKLNHVDKNRTELRKDLQQITFESNKTASEAKISHQRIKLLLIARIQDYRKELDFWKDTIRKIIYNQRGAKQDVNDLFDIVTKNLKTYGTRGILGSSEFESITTMAKLLVENEKKPAS